MVVFSTYVSPMDREYGKSTRTDPGTSDVGIGVKDIGWGLPMGFGAQNIQGIVAKVRQGAGAIEIQFPGALKGSRQGQTPGMYGKEQREAIRELAKINEINVTTHAGFNIMGLAGMDQQGNFSKDQRKVAVDEIRRAIEFAADAAQGGSVVVHTGEFPRPISEQPWAQDPRAPKGYKFFSYAEEPERAVFRLVDERTGQLVQQVRKNVKVMRPVWMTDDGKPKTAANNYVDYEGKIVDITNRVPAFDRETGRFRVKENVWDDFVQEAAERNRMKARELGRELREDEKVMPEEAFLRASLETNEAHSRGWAGYYARDFGESVESLNKLKKALEFYERLEASVPPEEKERLLMSEGSRLRQMTGLDIFPPEFKYPSEIIKDRLKSMRFNVDYSRLASSSQEQQADESRETQRHVVSARKYALKESYKSYAESGIHALNITRTKKLEKPVFVTMENIYPESYGSHPDELMNLISGSRQEMATILHKDYNYPMAEANKLAETHIKATIDLGHLNTWRKYWHNDPKKTMQENDNDFKKWFLGKVEEMGKRGMVGNVHLSDNFGYHDEHLHPGDGSTPIREAVEILRKQGYKGPLTVEAGASATTDVTDFHGLMKTWKLFGSPVYAGHAGAAARADVPKGSWADIQYSYFGQTKAPYYIFGPYAPSQDWTLWSQVPFE